MFCGFSRFHEVKSLGLSMVRGCSLNRSLKRRFVSPMYCKLLVSLVIIYFKANKGEEEGVVRRVVRGSRKIEIVLFCQVPISSNFPRSVSTSTP